MKAHVDFLQEALDTRLLVYNRLLADYLELKEAYETILDRQMENEMLIDKNAVLQHQLKAANEDAANLYIEAKYARMFNNPALEAHRVRIDAGDYDSSYDGLIPEEKE